MPVTDQEFLNVHIRLRSKSLLAANGCNIWLGSKDKDGYGLTRFRGRTIGVHKLAYMVNVGDVPAGKELDHLCRTHACWNPDHLEPVTHRENVLRGAIYTRLFCRKGHPFTPENIIHWRNRRICKICRHEQYLKHRKPKQKTTNE